MYVKIKSARDYWLNTDYIKPWVPWSGVCSLAFQLPRNPQEASEISSAGLSKGLPKCCMSLQRAVETTFEKNRRRQIQNVLQQHAQHMLSSLWRRHYLVPYWLLSCSHQLHTYQLNCRIVIIQSPMLQFHHFQQNLHGMKHQHSQTIFPSKIHCPWSIWIHHALPMTIPLDHNFY